MFIRDIVIHSKNLKVSVTKMKKKQTKNRKALLLWGNREEQISFNPLVGWAKFHLSA
tara:strand:+ start:769 stop:939 length:171 start_codon:yes stop_codon:yes gene_type:complete